MLKTEEKRDLLRIAREAVESLSVQKSVESGTRRATEIDPRPGLFVTIRLDGKLRGCVGLIQSGHPLREAVRDIARKAAFEDPRFPPMTTPEISRAKFEVSILGEIQPIASLEDFSVGVHGLMVESGRCRGLLLPQVASEHGWDRQEFIRALLQKGGLPLSAASDPETRFSMFLTEHMAEDQE